MGFLRAMCRNAAGQRWRIGCSSSSIAIARHNHSSAPIFSFLSKTNATFAANRSTTLPRSGNGGSLRGFAVEAAESAEADAEDPAGLVEDGADEEISLAYTLKPEEVEPCNKMLKTFMENHTSLSPVSIVEDWRKEGNKLTESILLKVFRKLRASERAGQAHRLMSWVLREKPISISEKVYLMAIMAAHKARKMSNARQIFDEIPDDQKTPAICTAMVDAYARCCEADSAESIMRTFTPKTAQAFNTLIVMYMRLGQYEKAVEIFEKLRKAGMKPNKVSFLTLAKYKKQLGIEIDKTEAEGILNECIDDLETNKTALYAAKNTMLAYAYMGDSEGVERTWSRLEKLESLPTYFWAMGIESFGVLGRVERAEELAEQVSERRRREEAFYPALIRAYAANDLMDKAEAVIQHLRDGGEEMKVTYQPFNEIIEAYLERDEPQKALEKMKEAHESVKGGRSRPSYTVVKKLLPLYRKTKDVEGAEALVRLTARVETVVYNELLKVYVAARKKPVDKFLDRLRKAKIQPDDETHQLLKKTDKFT